MDDLVVPHWEPHRIPIVSVHELIVPQVQRLPAEHPMSHSAGRH